MAFSWQEQVKPAGTQDIQCDIEYLDKSYIHVYLDGAETTAFTWTSTTNIRLNSPLSAETVVLLIRKTEREYLYIEFASGAPFIEVNVDSQNKQFLHLAQELVEGRAIPGFYGNISMNGYRITNLEDPQDAQDAATKSYVDGLHDAAVARADAQFARTLRVPESSVSLLPPAAGRSWTSLGFDGLGRPVVQDPSGTGLWGYVPVAGSFEQGSQLNQRFEVLLWESTDEYWRWDGEMPKDVPPDSTPATAGGTGRGKWVDVTDATLRSNLGSVDGFKLIGRCPDIASLRKTKPLYHGQAILLHKAIENGPDVNVLLSYDALDTTSSDDDCAIFVTEDGARWKYDLSNGYNTSLAGYNPAENNMAAVINKITAVITDNVIAAGKILGIPTTITLPNYQDNTHIMDEALVIPPFVSLRANTQHVFKFSNDSYGIKICTDFNSALSWSVVTSGFPSGNGDSGYKVYDGPRLIVMGPGRDSSTKSGILIGNKTNNSKAPVRDIDVAGIYVSGFKAVLEYGNYNTYNTFATNIHGEQNQYGLFTDDTSTQSNSGETHVLRDCTLSQNSKAHCHLGTRNVYFELYSCHLDYAPNVFEFGALAWWTRVTTYGGWFEGFENLAEAMGTGFTGAPELNMINPIIDARGYYESTWGGPRKIFKTTAGGKSKTLYVNLTDPKISFPKKPAYPSSLLSGLVTGYPAGDVTNSNIAIKTSYTKYKADAGYYPYPYLGHSSESLCGSSFAVGTPTGSPITNNFRGLEFRTSGSGTVVLVAADANYANQLSFDVTLTNASDYVDVTSLARIKLEYNDIVAATISVMPKEATGAINVAPALYHYSADKVVSTLMADNTIKNSISRNLIEITAPDASAYTNVLSYLSDPGTPATSSSFLGSQPTLAAMRNVWVYGDYTTEGQYEYSNLAIRLTGFVGTIRVMLPLWWKVGSN